MCHISREEFKAFFLLNYFTMTIITLFSSFVCVCVCVCERERERERESQNLEVQKGMRQKTLLLLDLGPSVVLVRYTLKPK